MSRKSAIVGAVIVCLGLPLLAQSPPADVLTALLAEVRQLRMAMEGLAGLATTTPQIQLLTARLTVQNERLTRATRDLDGVRQDLENAAATSARMTARFAEIEDLLTREVDAQRQAGLRMEQRGVKQEIEQQTAQEQRLRVREAELAAIAAAEQNQWMELNRRFDELERALSGRRLR